jgi:hypothetical protein
MAEPTLLDPFALMRDLVSQLEKGVNDLANPLMKTEGFAKGANNAMSAAMVATKLARELSQRYFEALNMPSRTDFLALADRLQSIEDRMINMQATLDELAGGGNRSALPAPARTRKPPAPIVDVAPAHAPKRPRKRKP